MWLMMQGACDGAPCVRDVLEEAERVRAVAHKKVLGLL